MRLYIQEMRYNKGPLQEIMMTRAQELGITEFPYTEKDENGNITYSENHEGIWFRHIYNQANELELIHMGDSMGQITLCPNILHPNYSMV
jgi:hypothetical protein